MTPQGRTREWAWGLLLAVSMVLGAETAAAQTGFDEGANDNLYETGSYGGAGGAWVEGKSGGVRLSGSLGPRAVPDQHVVRKGDTLWDITGYYFGNPWDWPRVWSYNPEITNPHWIFPDDKIWLKPRGAVQPLPGAPGAQQPAAATAKGGMHIEVVRPHVTTGNIVIENQGYLEKDALKRAGTIVGSPKEHMLLSVYDEVYLQFDKGTKVKPGKQYTIFRVIDDPERVLDEEGVLVRVFGVVRVTTYDPKKRLARAVITEALDPIERGYKVSDMPRQFRLVPAVPNAKTVEAKVVATLKPRKLLAAYQVIFVNVGAEQGVELGNRFFVTEKGDRWRESLGPESEAKAGAQVPGGGEPKAYPPEIVAEGRVVDVQKHTSALILTRSLREVSLGDRAVMQRGY